MEIWQNGASIMVNIIEICDKGKFHFYPELHLIFGLDSCGSKWRYGLAVIICDVSVAAGDSS